MPIPSSYEEYAHEFMRWREQSEIGVSVVLQWSRLLKPQSSVLDLGCGSGKPIATVLAQRGYTMYGIDTSSRLVEAYLRQVANASAVCESIESSRFYDRQFDAAIAIGLIFLLPEATQIQFIRRLASVVTIGGHLLFTAPTQVHTWKDVLTGADSLSLGRESYLRIGADAGFELENEWVDQGENHYFGFRRVTR